MTMLIDLADQIGLTTEEYVNLVNVEQDREK